MIEPLAELRTMAYPGRVIILGQSSGGDRSVVVYAITGRSPSSQARELKFKGNAIWTVPTDEEALKKGNTDLLVYMAVAFGRGIAVSNGRQTEEVLNQIQDNNDPQEVLRRGLNNWTYEPDSPHYTPRISGCILPNGRACLSLLRKGKDGAAQRPFFTWTLRPGKGKLIATYGGSEENPLPSFQGGPVDIDIEEGTAAGMAEAVYAALRPGEPEKDHRVAVAAVYAESSNLQRFQVSIINKKGRQEEHG